MNAITEYLKAGVDIIYSPQKTFEHLKEKDLRSPWLMLVVLMVFSTFISLAAAPIYMKLFQAEAANMENMPQMNITFFYVRAFITGLIAFPLMLFIEALVYYIFAPLADAELSYMDMFQVVVYSSVITVIAQFLKVSLVALTNNVFITFSLAVFLPHDEVSKTFIGRFLAQLDLFAIWSVYIIGVGMAVKGNSRKEKTLLVTYSVWLVWKLFVAVLGKYANAGRNAGNAAG